MASPFFFVNKKSGDLQPCQDYRKLNDATIKNTYPIPRVEDLLDHVTSAKPTIFTKLDLRAGYNNHLKEADLFLKPEKCFFDVSEVEFLGFILRPSQIGMAKDKVSAVLNWPKIDSIKALQWFLGFANFYQ
ncbi:uncharacterized protein FIBRA_09409 [Fibroporia radiculosa]|uniref:Reverse transcriptase domain-containing protein n=1 Tax=Fibroporia radiculosa TaxID=599839 RepID=J7S6F6_9APHY|nr:uncharacterized protein FIBRA_09409 [Fibroporia radiculosa]CCM07084.1 predicted protein [Fibroporia radiculosa]